MDAYLLEGKKWEEKGGVHLMRVDRNHWLLVRDITRPYDTCSRWRVNSNNTKIFASLQDAMMFAETEYLLAGATQ
jgi:hypothetical protein